MFHTLRFNWNNLIFRRVDGGVSKNDFVCQLLADMTGLEVERPTSTEMSILGTAYLAGLVAGVWKDKSQLRAMRKVEKVFAPTTDEEVKNDHSRQLDQWLNVVDRFKCWYTWSGPSILKSQGVSFDGWGYFFKWFLLFPLCYCNKFDYFSLLLIITHETNSWLPYHSKKFRFRKVSDNLYHSKKKIKINRLAFVWNICKWSKIHENLLKNNTKVRL